MRDMATEADMVEFRNAKTAVILMTPPWSNYPKAALQLLESLVADFVAQNIEVFTVTEDDPKANQPFTDWIAKQEGQMALGDFSRRLFLFGHVRSVSATAVRCSISLSGCRPALVFYSSGLFSGPWLFRRRVCHAGDFGGDMATLQLQQLGARSDGCHVDGSRHRDGYRHLLALQRPFRLQPGSICMASFEAYSRSSIKFVGVLIGFGLALLAGSPAWRRFRERQDLS
jgi:hypothetical protein